MVKQPNHLTCVAAVGAMIVGDEYIDNFVNYISHNPMMPRKDESGRLAQGYNLVELFQYLAHHGVIVGIGFESPPDVKTMKINRTSTLTGTIEFDKIEAIVSILRHGRFHCVLWDGEKIWDPTQHGPDHPELESLDILDIWPYRDTRG